MRVIEYGAFKEYIRVLSKIIVHLLQDRHLSCLKGVSKSVSGTD